MNKTLSHRLYYPFTIVLTFLLIPFSYAEEPSAIVEDITDAPNAGIEMLDYAYPGQEITLGANGVLKLAYFANCRIETITGGQAVIGKIESEIQGGKLDISTIDCQENAAITTADASEAGAGVLRVTPFGEDNWRESTLKSDKPIFKWPTSSDEAIIKVTSMDEKEPVDLVTLKSNQSFVIYPTDGPALIPGKPYLVTVDSGETVEITKIKKIGRREKETKEEIPLIYTALFSIDPNLEIDDNAANRIVRLQQK